MRDALCNNMPLCDNNYAILLCSTIKISDILLGVLCVLCFDVALPCRNTVAGRCSLGCSWNGHAHIPAEAMSDALSRRVVEMRASTSYAAEFPGARVHLPGGSEGWGR